MRRGGARLTGGRFIVRMNFSNNSIRLAVLREQSQQQIRPDTLMQRYESRLEISVGEITEMFPGLLVSPYESCAYQFLAVSIRLSGERD